MSIFSQIQLRNPKRSSFDLSHAVRTTLNMGELIPTNVIECMPGDRFTLSSENMMRFQPLIAPLMHRCRVKTHHFFVPNRLLWANWAEWITGNLDVEHPSCAIPNLEPGMLGHYMGLPKGVTSGININPMPAAAYLLIYDEYFRDQNLMSKQFIPLVNGDNDVYSAKLSDPPLKRAWGHDYFTSALPFAQKGDAAQLPLVDQEELDVYYKNSGAGVADNIWRFRDAADGTPEAATGSVSAAAPPSPLIGSAMYVGSGNPVGLDPNGTLKVDVQAEAATINDLRRAFRLQEWLEKNARGGTRYIETILSHFGVRSKDSRLQRPEYIGGSVQNMVISEVLSTAQTGDNSDIQNPVGQMAGHGISVGKGDVFNYSVDEHGWIISLISVIPDTAYAQGIHRKFTRFDRLDYPWPTFAEIGEQEILNREIYAQSANPGGTFGYIPRYSEFKFENDRYSGDMDGNLDFWHLGRKFATEPVLNDEFITCNPRKDVFAVTDESVPSVIAFIYNNVRASRPLPRYGTPTI